MKIAFITNLPSHFHKRLFEVIGEHYDAEFFFFSNGGEAWVENRNELSIGKFRGSYVHGLQLTKRLRLNLPLVAKLFLGRFDVFIHSINGRFELFSTFVVSRVLRKPLILWTNLWFHPDTLVHRLTKPLTRYLYRHVDAIVVYGSHVRDYLLTFGVEEQKIFYSWNVTDNSIFNAVISRRVVKNLRQSLGIQNGKVILFVGRLSVEKGLRYLLSAFKSLPPKVIHHLVIVGSGPEENSLKALVSSDGLKNVHFVDHVPNARLVTYYAMADVFVLPSITTPTLKEVWGIVLNEAMNQGVPVVATSAVGAAVGGLVVEGKNGFVVPERDAAALSNAISRILNNTRLRHSMSTWTRRWIQHWDHAKSFEGFRAAIDFVVASRKGTAHSDTNLTASGAA